MPHTLLSLDEAAEVLHLPRMEVQTMALRDILPSQRRGERVTFRKGDLQAWASEHVLGLNEKQLAHYHKTTTSKATHIASDSKITQDMMCPSFMVPELPAKTRASVMKSMVEAADETGHLMLPDELGEAIREREDLGSTAMAGGFALLHAREHEPYMVEESFVILGRTVQPIPFGAPDGERTDLFFLICCQDDRIHLHVLARLCLLCSQTPILALLREAPDASTMYQALVEAEEAVVAAL